MADRQRLKAVAEDGGSSSEDDRAEGSVPERLDLGLSLGRWRVPCAAGGGTSEAAPPAPPAPVEDLRNALSLGRWGAAGLVGPSRAAAPAEDLRNARRLLTLGVTDPAEFAAMTRWDWRVWRDLEQQEAEELHPMPAVDAGGERDRDFQSKRPKVLAYTELYDTITSNLGAEASAPPATVDTSSQCSVVRTEYEMVICPISNDHCGPVLRNSNDGRHVDSDISITKDNEDVENRMDLTEDLLNLVFSFLGQKDLCKAGATCKQWQAASMHEDFWKCLNFENTEISPQNFDAICRRYPNATEVNIFGIYNLNVLAMAAMSSLRRLETLILGKEQLGDNFFQALTNCRTLKSLSICDSSLGNGMQEISVYHDRLLELHIMKCRVLRVSVRCPQLRSLSLRRTTTAHALLTCPQLRELDIASCHKLSDVGIRSAATSCPLLTSLDMSSCSCVSDETLREIASACPNLSVLDASYCPNIILESVRLPMLVELKLHTCEGIATASMSAISHSRMLEVLQLDNCGLLTSVSLELPHLRSISLVHCRKFVELTLQSPALSYIKVSNCSSLHRMSITSKGLRKLVLQKQESLSTLSLQCPNLQEVDLSDCESLINTICEVFSDGGGCPMLNSLILDNCESLIFVGLNSSSLATLSLVGCHGMTALELSCPNLQKVNLDGCDHLERASFFPVGLESLNLGICPKLSILQIDAPRMLVLELKGCGVLSQASINCPSLRSLDASFCRQFMDDSLSTTAVLCHRIDSLILSSCLSIGDDGLSSLHMLHRLTFLDLSYTFLTNLQPVFDSCLHLVILKLSACKYLTNTSLDALYKEGALPALRELDLSYSSIGQAAIAELLASCTNLVNVNLNGCAKMNDLVWSSSDHYTEMPIDNFSPNFLSVENNDEELRKPQRLLEILNCIGCPNIKKVLIPSTAGCLHLSKFNLNLSTNLKEVDISCSNLSILNLSHCNSLDILKLDCPRLANLQLLACNMLEVEVVVAAISGCRMLEILNVHSCPKIHAVCVGRLRMACPSLKRIQCSLSS